MKKSGETENDFITSREITDYNSCNPVFENTKSVVLLIDRIFRIQLLLQMTRIRDVTKYFWAVIVKTKIQFY